MKAAILTTVLGLLLCAWAAAGRALFGFGGDLILIYSLAALIPAALYLATGHAWRRALERGFSIRPATIGILSVSWGCALVLGATIPDVRDAALVTLLSGPDEPGLGIAIGLSNPLAIIMVATAAFATGFAVSDSRGGPRNSAEDYDEPAAHPLAGTPAP